MSDSRDQGTRIYIVPARIGARGRSYDIYLGAADGEHLGTSRTPFYDGARLLLFRGITGRFEMWSADVPHPRMVGDIETCTGLMVLDEDRDGLRIRRWRPPEARQDTPQDALSGPADQTPLAGDGNARWRPAIRVARPTWAHMRAF